MPTHATGFRTTVFRGLALLMSVLLPLAGMPLPASAQSEGNAPAADPPSLVGQLTRLSGTVSFHTADETSWQPADANYPITSGNALWTEPGASASVVFGANRLTMDQSTELDIGTLDQHRLAATVPQGAVYLHVRSLQPGDQIAIATPRGTVTIGQPGSYEIASGDQTTPTRVTVLQGAAQVYGTGVSTLVAAGQTATIIGSSPFTASLGPAQNDAFIAAQAAAAPAPPPSGVAPPPVVAQMTGGDELEDTGTWQDTPQYGDVWYPPVAPGWEPYQNGNWAYVAPWGWTWVDAAPWGFAPFHYGRWLVIGGRWAWVPVVPGVALGLPPVYAPALVAFFGVGVGVGIEIGFGRPVGWVPLAPYEPYRPWYRASPAYIRGINRVSVRDVNRLDVNGFYRSTTIDRFANHNAATVVPSQVMSGSRPVRENLQHVGVAQFANARPFTASPVRPTAATMGLTPGVARQFGMAPVRSQRPAPGPVVRPLPAGAPVPLRPTGGAPVVRPAISGPRPASPEPGAARPGTARPGAPGPTIRPRAPGALPPLRPSAPEAPRAPARPNATPAGRPATPQFQQPRAAEPRAEPQRLNAPLAPRAPTPQAPRAPQFQQPRAEPQPQRYAPPREVAPPRPEVARPEPARPAPAREAPRGCEPGRPGC